MIINLSISIHLLNLRSGWGFGRLCSEGEQRRGATARRRRSTSGDVDGCSGAVPARAGARNGGREAHSVARAYEARRGSDGGTENERVSLERRQAEPR